MSAWWGGFWERLVRSVNVSLHKGLGRSTLNFEECTTVLKEVEAVIKSRSLTFFYTKTEEPSQLSQGYFLGGRKVTTLRRIVIRPQHLRAASNFFGAGDAAALSRTSYREGGSKNTCWS
ncbi:hypothetical protein HPB48_013220 [Haemaphysalis longicornis]|uniref:Uncharacterized protein n=1 Tax=Haemaphysalis longicornis TaxID=44386 RepID=A0A9J6GWR4_HAELO|nr:hypothetical protein HPB48_013220 [Haemaphysalis longicornis]